MARRKSVLRCYLIAVESVYCWVFNTALLQHGWFYNTAPRLVYEFKKQSFSSSDVFHLIKWRATKLSVVGSVVAVPSIVMNSLRSLPLVGRLVTMVFGKVQSEGAAPAAAHGHLHSA